MRVNEDYLVAIASCFHVQNNAGECRRKSTFLYKISTNTTTSIKCCRSVTRDYPSCTIMSALLPLQRIAGVFFLYNYVCTNTISNYLFFAQLCLHKYYYIYNVLQECHKKINFLQKYFFIYRVFFYWSLKVSLGVLGLKYTDLPKETGSPLSPLSWETDERSV